MSGSMPAGLRRQVSRSSFYAGMRVLPGPERGAMFAIYAFCRAVDDVADDEGRERGDRAAALDGWRAAINALYDGGDPGEAGFLAEPVRRFGLARADFQAVIDGMAMDVARDIRWPSLAELDLYCDRVAAAVGRLSVRVFGMEAAPGEQLAFHLGRALQLTNILRDIEEDAAVGRVYIPIEALATAGIAPTTPTAIATDPRMDVAARIVADAARGHYAAARAILDARPRGHLLAPRLMDAVYARVLARMEAIGWATPQPRVRVSRLTLLWLIVRMSLAPR